MALLKESVITIDSVSVTAYKIPTATEESDGTYTWNHTVLVMVEIEGGDVKGIGYTYADLSTALLIKNTLSNILIGNNLFDIPMIFEKMLKSIRNLGRPGIASMAIAAIDTALWDLKAKILNLPLLQLWGAEKEKVELYGSGGFTNYTQKETFAQLDLWMKYGIKKIKLKVGSHPKKDIQRVIEVKNYLSNGYEIFVDANGALTKKEALMFSEEYANLGVTWFEEPVSSDDVEGLKYITDHSPASINITTGEYGYDVYYFKNFLESRAVDILQVDATRCEGYTGFLRATNLISSFHIPVSTHCAPYLHLPAACASKVIHMEYFYDHMRIETKFFEGAKEPINGCLQVDHSIPGIGLEFKKKDAEQYMM